MKRDPRRALTPVGFLRALHCLRFWGKFLTKELNMLNGKEENTLK